MSATRKITPVISTTALNTATTAGSNVITPSSVTYLTTQMRLVGPGIPFNSIIDTIDTDAGTCTIIDAVTKEPAPATATAAAASVRYGYFTSAQYADGDALGFPFAVDMEKIVDAMVLDARKQLTKARLYFFSKKFVESADNATFAPSDADITNFSGYIALGTAITLSNNKIIKEASTDLPVVIGGTGGWCQLVVDTDTPTFGAVDDLTVTLTGE